MKTKTNVIDRIRHYSSGKKYFSFKGLKLYLKNEDPNLKENTLKSALSRLKANEEIYDAGKGYYSLIKDNFVPDEKPVRRLKNLLKEKYPFLDYYLWSTDQINVAFHHTFTSSVTFIHAEEDFLDSIKDSLRSPKYSVFVNPSIKLEIDKYVELDKDTIILRPSITRVSAKNHDVNIETILVDLFLERKRLILFDKSEYDRIFDYFISNYRLDIGYLLKYSARRKVQEDFISKLETHTITT
ncbi:MAG: hypothetical protein KKB34_16665 [Bacteroidetes bacterium]|nr:hypothetical protein [Bacteroidota bacterium]